MAKELETSLTDIDWLHRLSVEAKFPTNPNKSLSENICINSTPQKRPNPNANVPKKPNYSYANLITCAIQSAPMKKMKLAEIYDWICDHHPYYKKTEKGWKNSVRHILSLGKCFKRTAKNVEEAGKGSYWSIDETPSPPQKRKKVHENQSPSGTQLRLFDTSSNGSLPASSDGSYLSPSTSSFGPGPQSVLSPSMNQLASVGHTQQHMLPLQPLPTPNMAPYFPVYDPALLQNSNNLNIDGSSCGRFLPPITAAPTFAPTGLENHLNTTGAQDSTTATNGKHSQSVCLTNQGFPELKSTPKTGISNGRGRDGDDTPPRLSTPPNPASFEEPGNDGNQKVSSQNQQITNGGVIPIDLSHNGSSNLMDNTYGELLGDPVLGWSNLEASGQPLLSSTDQMTQDNGDPSLGASGSESPPDLDFSASMRGLYRTLFESSQFDNSLHMLLIAGQMAGEKPEEPIENTHKDPVNPDSVTTKIDSPKENSTEKLNDNENETLKDPSCEETDEEVKEWDELDFSSRVTQLFESLTTFKECLRVAGSMRWCESELEAFPGLSDSLMKASRSRYNLDPEQLCDLATSLTNFLRQSTSRSGEKEDSEDGPPDLGDPCNSCKPGGTSTSAGQSTDKEGSGTRLRLRPPRTATEEDEEIVDDFNWDSIV